MASLDRTRRLFILLIEFSLIGPLNVASIGQCSSNLGRRSASRASSRQLSDNFGPRRARRGHGGCPPRAHAHTNLVFASTPRRPLSSRMGAGPGGGRSVARLARPPRQARWRGVFHRRRLRQWRALACGEVRWPAALARPDAYAPDGSRSVPARGATGRGVANSDAHQSKLLKVDRIRVSFGRTRAEDGRIWPTRYRLPSFSRLASPSAHALRLVSAFCLSSLWPSLSVPSAVVLFPRMVSSSFRVPLVFVLSESVSLCFSPSLGFLGRPPPLYLLLRRSEESVPDCDSQCLALSRRQREVPMVWPSVQRRP